MRDLFLKYGMEIAEETERKFAVYAEYLLAENEKYNLTSITEPSDVIVKHFLDSAMGAKYVPQHAKLADVGSGAGFPAIPLKLVRDDIALTMLDATAKKAKFLAAAADLLKIRAEVITARAEEFARSPRRASFDVVTARAVARLPVIMEYTVPLLKVGGVLIAYKSDLSELDFAKNAMSNLNCKVKSAETYNLEGNERALIVIEKCGKTDSCFPRANSAIKRNPLK